MFTDENMNKTELPGTSSISSSEFVKEKNDPAKNDTIIIDNITYNKKEELKKLEMLIKQVSNEVRILKEIMGNGNSENNSSLSNVMEAHSEFPIQTYTQLVAFDNKLKEDHDYGMKIIYRLRTKTTKYDSINKKVKEALNVILDRNLARNINWSGRSSRRDHPKHGFQQFQNIFKILLGIDENLVGERAVIYAIQSYFNSI